jgi:hypothetical protein
MKIRLTFLITALILLFASCSAPAAKPADAEPAASGFGETDLIFVLDGAEYPLCSDAEPLLEALGDDYEMEAAESCAYVGEDKVFDYSNIIIYTNPIDGKDIFFLIEITGGDYQTSKGVKVGSTLGEVKAAYGDGGFKKEDTYIYSLSGDEKELKSRRLMFELDDNGSVTIISFFDPSTNLSL